MVSSWRCVSFYVRMKRFWRFWMKVCSFYIGTVPLWFPSAAYAHFIEARFLIPWKGWHQIQCDALPSRGRKMQTSLLKYKSQVLAGGVSLPYFLCGDPCPWATLESHCWPSFCSLPLPIRRALYCWSSARHLLYYLVNVMDASFSASSLFGAKTWDSKLGGD